MKIVSLLIGNLIAVTSLHALAKQVVIIPTQVREINLGYGDGSLPAGTIQSHDGEFQIVFNQKIQFENFAFVENFDSMCELNSNAFLANNSVLFKIYASSSESSRCVLNYELLNGETGQIIGIFSGGE